MWRKTEDSIEATYVQAARLQHRYVHRIRVRLADRGMSVEDYAKEAGSSYGRMSRLLRGEIVMRLEDIAVADRVLKEVSELDRERAVAVRKLEAERKAERENAEPPLVRDLERDAATARRKARQARGGA